MINIFINKDFNDCFKIDLLSPTGIKIILIKPFKKLFKNIVGINILNNFTDPVYSTLPEDKTSINKGAAMQLNIENIIEDIEMAIISLNPDLILLE